MFKKSIFAVLAAAFLGLGVGGCCLDDGEVCDDDADCCSDYCVYDDIEDENFCEP